MRFRVATFLLLISTVAASAHPLGFSGLRVQILPGPTARAALTLHTRDLSAWFPPASHPNYISDVCREIVGQSGELLEFRADGNEVTATNVKALSPDVGMIEVDLDYPLSGATETITIWSKHLPRMPSGHQQLLFVDDCRVNGKVTTLLQDSLAVDHDAVEVELPALSAPSTAPSTQPVVAQNPTLPGGASSGQSTAPRGSSHPHQISFFMLGIEHIVTGYDHLLFLAALLLVCKTFKEAAGVVTFFTIAHSITLTLAALDIVRMPARIVEPAIAASIVYVGLENIFGNHRFIWRAGITFAFGLVHGLGFASALREVGLGSTSVGVAMPLLKFSVGLETGQLCIAAVLLRILLTLRAEREWYVRRWVPAGSILISLIGGYWLVTRVLQS